MPESDSPSYVIIMIADVRLKVRMRLRALIAEMTAEYDTQPSVRVQLDMARKDSTLAATQREYYRIRVQNAFPGSTIVYTQTRILVHLPDTYPRSAVPISQPYPRVLTPVLFGIPSTEPF